MGSTKGYWGSWWKGSLGYSPSFASTPLCVERSQVTAFYPVWHLSSSRARRCIQRASEPGKVVGQLVLGVTMQNILDKQRISEGFRKGKSCLTNLTSFSDKVTHLGGEGKAVAVVSLSGLQERPWNCCPQHSSKAARGWDEYCVWQHQGRDCPPVLGSGEATPQVLYPVLEGRYLRGWSESREGKGLEQKSCEGAGGV